MISQACGDCRGTNAISMDYAALADARSARGLVLLAQRDLS
ncbi:hypothetical protein [Sphingomonas telluris]|nr:hypothetical protein [Sphingomonas telluris]